MRLYHHSVKTGANKVCEFYVLLTAFLNFDYFFKKKSFVHNVYKQ